MPFTPPGPSSFAAVITRWIKSSQTSFMVRKVSRIAVNYKIVFATGLGRELLIGHPVRPAKAGLFSGRQSHRGRSQRPVA